MARGDKQISFRVSPDEYAKIKEMADRAGLSIASLAKKATLDEEVKEQVIDRETGRQIISALGKIGSNINQIARKVNSGENTDAVLSIMKVSDQISDFWKFLIDGKVPKHKTKKKKEVSPSSNFTSLIYGALKLFRRRRRKKSIVKCVVQSLS